MTKSAACEQSARASGGSRAARWLALAATPVFAAMAWVIATDPGTTAALCSPGRSGLPIGGMPTMYLLMSVFHLPPWLRRRPQTARS